MNQKGLAPILIVVLIAIALGGYLSYTNYSNNQIKTTPPPQNPQNTSQIPQPSPKPLDKITNWKEFSFYNNDLKYGFSFKHPPEWKISYNERLNRPKTADERDMDSIDFGNATFQQSTFPENFFLEVWYVKKGNIYDMTNPFVFASPDSPDLIVKLVEQNKIQSNNLEITKLFTKITFRQETPSYVIEYFFQKDQFSYRLALSFREDKLPKYQDNLYILDEIIKTFKAVN